MPVSKKVIKRSGRIVFSAHQQKVLLEAFHQYFFCDAPLREKLAAQLKITEKQVGDFFKNHRSLCVNKEQLKEKRPTLSARKRITFTEHQKKILKYAFKLDPKMNGRSIDIIVEYLGLTRSHVLSYFARGRDAYKKKKEPLPEPDLPQLELWLKEIKSQISTNGESSSSSNLNTLPLAIQSSFDVNINQQQDQQSQSNLYQLPLPSFDNHNNQQQLQQPLQPQPQLQLQPDQYQQQEYPHNQQDYKYDQQYDFVSDQQLTVAPQYQQPSTYSQLSSDGSSSSPSYVSFPQTSSSLSSDDVQQQQQSLQAPQPQLQSFNNFLPDQQYYSGYYQQESHQFYQQNATYYEPQFQPYQQQLSIY
ncbi:myb-like protein Q [Panonychus citri]|uniref:myb-like protein Q n=1 Tax=Panonychus citri TaxID=50023 RepID=UPI0023074A1E|nr:myb-like protein Q [Panonychus citri]